MAARKHYDSIAIEQIESDETDDEDVFFNDPRRNLLKDFSKTSSNETNLNVGEEHMKVYLRIRPLSEDEQNRQENQSCVEVEDDNHVVTHAPKDSHTFKNCTHGLGKTTQKFTFSKIFSETTSQKDLFDQTMLGLVKDFISGQNCLVFTYGVTSSGKTYTIQGQPSDAGVLPRALDVLFNSINGKQVEGMKLKPNMFTDVTKLSSAEEEAEKNFKEKTLKMSNDDEPDVMSLLGEDASDITNTTTCSESSNVSYANSERQKASLDPEDLLSEIEERVREETAVSVEDQGSIKFSIWVSFAEIYNEQIFDLLVSIPKKKNVRRPVLKLSDDKKGSPYIKGLKEIHVTSADEAYKLLTIGKQNLRTACTKLNHQSSRSHCIFNIKIVRVMDVDDPHVARVSMLSLCDLAGSERYSKTQSNGERLKEAGNINTSLMTLGRCIEMLRYNQHHKEKQKIIPFRDSKLTRLFQNFFSGRGKAAMIVNVNQCASMFDETLHVFKFSAIAKQVVVIQKPDPPPRPRLLTISVPPPVESVRAPSIAWATPGQLHTAEKIPLPEDEEDNLGETDEVAELVHVIEEMEKEIRGLRKEMRHQEGRIREEVCQEMMKQFVAIENECRERIRWTEELAEETMEKRIKVFTDAYKDQRKSAKKSKQSQRMEDEDDEWVSSILLHQEKVKVEEKEKEVSRLQQQIREFEQQDSTEKTKDDQTSVVEEMSLQLTELRETVSEKDEEIDKLNEMLEEAGETFAEKETELSRLHNLISGHEDKIKEQGRTTADLEEALRESRLALDTADRRLTQQEDAATTQNEAKAKLQGTKGKLQKVVSKSTRVKYTPPLFSSLDSPASTSQNKNVILRPSTELISKFNPSKRILQLIVTPLQNKILAHHTRTSLLRLRNSPAKDPTRGRACLNRIQETDKENPRGHKNIKRKLVDDNDTSLSKRRRVSLKRNRVSGSRETRRRISGKKYNLRSKRFVCLCLVAEELSTVKGCVGFLEQTVKQKEEEVRVWKSRCQRAEEDSIKQEQALINGYKAEISTLKQQMLEMKSNSSVTKTSTLLCDSSPRKKVMDEEKDTFYQNLSVQLKELQAELDRNSAVTLELQQALETARAVSEDLDQQLGQEKNGHKETRAQLSQLVQENEELQQLKVKVTQLENSFEDREQNLASEVEQNLRAEGLIAELEEELRTFKSADYPDQAVRLEKEVATLQESLAGKEEELETLTEKVEELETVNGGLREMVNQTTADLQAKEHMLTEVTAKIKVNEDMKQSALSPSSPLSSLQRRMKEIRHESEATKKELTTTVKEHKKLQGEFSTAKVTIKEGQEKVDQLTSHIKDLEFQLDESQIDRSHIMEDQRIAEDKVDQLQVKVEELEKCVEERNTQLTKLNGEMEQLVAKGEKEDQIERQNIEGMKEELEQAKQDLDTKRQLAENMSEELQKIKDELKQISKKGSKGSKKVIERLEGQCEQLGQTIKDREAEIERLKSELSAIQSSADTGVIVKSNQIDSLHDELKNLQTEMAVMEKKIADRDRAIKDLNELYEQDQKELDEKDFTLRTLRKEKEKASGESERAVTQKLTKLQEELEAKTERICELETMEEKTKQLEDEIASLRQKLSELENVNEEKEQVENELEGKAQKLSKLETVNEKKEQVENELASLRDKLKELENVTQEKEQLEKELASLRDKIIELENVTKEKKQLENELASLGQNLSELKTVKDENEQVMSELKSLRQKLCEFKSLQEEKEELVKELEDNTHRLCELKLKEKLIQLQEELDCKETKMCELNTAREKDEGELKSQAEGISKLSEQVESTESRIKDLMTERSELEKKAESLEESLHGKDHQLEELKKVLTDLQNETKMSSNETNSELSKVKMELAETKSALHMTNTLHQRAKKELLEKTKHAQELEERSKVRCEEEVSKKAEMEEEMAAVKGKLVELESLKHDLESKNQTVKCLNNELEVAMTKVGDLTSQNAETDRKMQELEGKITVQSEQSKIQLQQEEEKLSALVKACEEKSSIIESQAAKIKELAGDKDKSDVLVTEVGQKIKKIEELTNTINQLETKLHNSEVGRLPCSPQKERQDLTRQLEDLQNTLERERVKSEEYHKLLEEMRVKACLSPGSESSSVRRLRKDKIDADNALLEAKCKISSLERRLADSNLQISPRKYKDEESQKLKLELQECHQKMETLEGTSEAPRANFLITTTVRVSSRALSPVPTVHRELNRSQEREQTLRRQLQQASTSLQELGHKVSDLEDQLSHKVKAIQDAEDTIQALKNPGSRSGRPSTVAEVCRLEAELKQRWGQIQELQSDLIRRDEKLSAKSQALKDFKISMERERNDFEAALTDAKANESLIEMLKNAITEQEETMEKQDSYLHRKEEEIRNLSQELEKYTDKYRQVLESTGDSGRRMMELTRENVRQVTEHSQQLKEQEEKVCRLTQTLQEQETAVRKLTDDKEKLGLVLKENNKELKDLEKLLSESRTETESLRERLNSNTESKSDATEKAESEVAILQVKMREKEHALRDSQRSLRRLEEELNKAQQQANHSEAELMKVKQALEEKESQLKTWRTERDNLVAGLEGIMKKQQKEICDLKDQVKANQRGRHHDDSIVSPSKSSHTSHREDNTTSPPARPPAPVRSSFRNNHHDDQDMTPDKLSHKGHCQGESTSNRSTHSRHHRGDKVLSPVRSAHKAHHQGSVTLSPVIVKEEVPSGDSSSSDDRLKSPHPGRETSHRSHRQSSRKMSTDQCPLTKTPNTDAARSHRSSSRRSRKRRSVSESELELPAKKRDNFDATFASEESSISDHVQIDATPPVAARNLRKSRKKQGNTESEGKENTGPSSSLSSSRRTRRGTKGTEEPGLGRIGSIVSAIKNSSLTRSAKKLLDDISESPVQSTRDSTALTNTQSTPDSHYVEVEDQGTQMSGGRKQEHTKRSRKRHQLYNESLHISEPLEGGLFVPNTPTNDVHGIVLRKLRTRKH
ncbi:LOW QUALITY PROTEIN: kinesin-like protein KIF20B [Pecten maximus]|uniref:LOW QUALITY PROTEIN: kinesin-like protein KIF20B n=1 Tax=Pecten maximus TaxID=6579 RepID=UPI0014590828|nr:LOW QUALITY PROTEIN: kinesin-like protein KIF20B [Pecten maximus]